MAEHEFSTNKNNQRMGFRGDSRNSTFIMVYEDVWQALLGDPDALAVYMALRRRTHDGNRSWYAKKKEMAEESGVSVATFERRIKALQEHELVSVTHQYRDPKTQEISATKGGRFTEQIQNIYTVPEHTAAWYEAIANAPTSPHTEVGSPHAEVGVASQRGANIDPLHTSQTHTKERGASAPVADAPSPTPRKKQAHELPEGWRPDPKVWEQMSRERPDVDLEAEHRKFVDYWPAQPGAKSRKKDWNATWRNWIRNARPSQNNGRKVENTLEAWGFVSEGSNLPWEDPAPTFDDAPFIDHQEVF